MSTRLLPGLGDPIYEVQAPETVTLPGGYAPGRTVIYRRTDTTTGTVTVQAGGSDQLNGAAGGTVSVPAGATVVFTCFDPGRWRSSGSGGGDGPLLADSFTYDGSGRIASSTSGGVTTAYTYNTDGTVATEVRNGQTKTYSYDASKRITGTVVS